MLPVAEVNFYVYSCSSDRIAMVRALIADAPIVLALAEAANLIYFTPSLLLFFDMFCSSAAASCSAFNRAAWASIAICTSDFYCGAIWDFGSKFSALRLNLVPIPDRFLRTNVVFVGLLIVHWRKLNI